MGFIYLDIMNRRVFLPSYFILNFLLSISSSYITAQQLDSCKEMIPASVNIDQDSLGYYLLQRAAAFLEQDSLKIAEQLLDCSGKAAVKSNDNYLATKVDFAKAQLFYKSEKYSEALEYYKQALKLSLEMKDTIFAINSLSELSGLFHELGFADSAFKYCEREMQLNKAIKNYRGVSDNFRKLLTIPRYTIGGLSESKFITIGFLDSSVVYARKSKNFGAIACALANLAVRTFVDDQEKGLQLVKSAIDTARLADTILYHSRNR